MNSYGIVEEETRPYFHEWPPQLPSWIGIGSKGIAAFAVMTRKLPADSRSYYYRHSVHKTVLLQGTTARYMPCVVQSHCVIQFQLIQFLWVRLFLSQQHIQNPSIKEVQKM